VLIFAAMKLLIIEDEKQLATSMIEFLEQEKYTCTLATSVDDALGKIRLYEYECVILDVMLPDGTGFQVLEQLQRDGKTEGVIIISAKHSVDDRIKGLRLGADDYLTKPFHLAELLARVSALIRRKNFHGSNSVTFRELTVDVLSRQVRVHAEPVELTRKELDLLLFLIANSGRVISKNAIAEHLSGDMADMLDNHGFVYAHIKNLKKKLSEKGCVDYIKTVYGFGYRWQE
jgi:DNA-binding response OmpR family regulator